MSYCELAMVSALAAGSVFAVALMLLLVRPRRVPDWVAALGGGSAMVALGILPAESAVSALGAAWNIFLFFFGLGLAAAVADRSGLFSAVANLAARIAGGNQQRLLIAVGAIGALITAVLSNDATALLLTPVAFTIATRLGLDPRPYAFVCAFVANAASFVLPVSNPTNLVVLAQAPLPFGTFLHYLLLPSVMSIAITILSVSWYFRGELAAPFELPAPRVGFGMDRRVSSALAGVAGLGAFYVIGAAFEWPLGVVAVLGAIALFALDGLVGAWEPREVAREVPWALFPLFAGLLLLVNGAEHAGIFSRLVDAIAASARLTVAAPAIIFGTAVLANTINNLPAALVAGSALAGLPPEVLRGDLVAGVLVGVNLGPNLTTAGSLATMLWLLLLRRRGVEISARSYVQVGVVVTLPALAAASVGLWLMTWVAG